MPVWTWISRRTEKHIALKYICLWSTLSYLIYIPAALIGGFWPLVLAALISGLSFGSHTIFLRAMMADVIEREEKSTGENRSGIYYAIVTGAYKTGASLAVGLPIWSLDC